MSSTNRGGKRSEADFYATPPWVVDRFLDEFQFHTPTRPWPNLPGGRWLEPAGGDGAIIRTVNARRSDLIWSAAEIRPEAAEVLSPLTEGRLYTGDFLTMPADYFGPEKFDVAITNPPFRIALPFVKKCMEVAKMTILLLRLNFWGSEARQKFLRDWPPNTYVLPNRPMFSLNQKGLPGTDSPEYGWFVWYDEPSVVSYADIQVLRTTPPEERKRWGHQLREIQAKKALLP